MNRIMFVAVAVIAVAVLFIILKDSSNFSSEVSKLREENENQKRDLEHLKEELRVKNDNEKKLTTRIENKDLEFEKLFKQFTQFTNDTNKPGPLTAEKPDKPKGFSIDKKMFVGWIRAIQGSALRKEWDKLKKTLNLSNAQYEILMTKLEEFYDTMIKELFETFTEEDMANPFRMRDKGLEFANTKQPELEKMLLSNLTPTQFEEYKTFKQEQFKVIASSTGSEATKVISKKLDLTKQQEESVNNILTNYVNTKLKPLELFLQPPDMQARSHFLLVDAEVTTQVKTVLSPEQSFKYDQYIKNTFPLTDNQKK